MASVVIGILFFLLSLLALLQFYRFQTLLFEVNSSRISVYAQSLKSGVERSLALGLTVQSNVQLQSMLDAAIEQYPDIQSVQLVEDQSSPVKVFWASGAVAAESETLSELDSHRKARKDMWFDASHPASFIQIWSIKDPLGRVVADLILRVDNSAAKTLLADARMHLLQFWFLLCLASLLFLAPILLYLFMSLDRLIRSANSILQGQAPQVERGRHSEIRDLATQVANSGLSYPPKGSE